MTLALELSLSTLDMSPAVDRFAQSISRLPVELLIIVFYYLLPTDSYPSVTNSDLLTTLQVCERWRSTALSISSLWCRFHIVVTDTTTSHTVNALRFWLSFSKHQNLYVSMNYCPPRHTLDRRFNDISIQLVELLLDHSPRWRQMSFTVPSLALQPMCHNRTQRNCANLRSLQLHTQGVWNCNAVTTRALLLGLDLRGLMELDLQLDYDCELTVSELVRVCQVAKGLVKCKVDVKMDGHGGLSPAEWHRIEMPHLEELALGFTTRHIPDHPTIALGEFLDDLHLPILRCLHLRWDVTSDLETMLHYLSSFVYRVQDTLKVLRLHDLSESSSLVEQIFPAEVSLDERDINSLAIRIRTITAT